LIGRLLAAHRVLEARSPLDPPPLAWRLRGMAVCASTELELERWLAHQSEAGDPRLPLAVLARHQTFGHGQQGRRWSSPPGGVWLSAALPWPQDPAVIAAPSLAVVVGVAREIEALLPPARRQALRIKWPNDLLLDGRKLAGVLPRLRLRAGRIRWTQVGVGLNGRNPVPRGAISLQQVLGRHHPCAEPLRLAARILRGLEWAVAQGGEPELVRREAERRLELPREPLVHEGRPWQVLGLEADGALRLGSGDDRTLLRRRF
jgi:BirA family biotin operon repressor/biotin-[acetyl-CoA-carboxylase] ligase